jgi:hypothetical protein
MLEPATLAEVRRRLGPEVVTVLEQTGDRRLAEEATRGLLIAEGALAAVDAFDLHAHETRDLDSADPVAPDLSIWNAVAPEVRNLLVTMQRAVDDLDRLFPANEEETATEPIDFDALFDAMQDGPRPEPIRDSRDLQLDAIVARSVDRQREIAEAVTQLTTLMRADFATFGQRLRNPQVVADRWFLLGELQELKGKCAQGLEAVLAAILSALSREPVEALLPRYQSATRRAVQLRTLVVDLAEDIAGLHQALEIAEPEQAGVIVLSMAERLDDFIAAPAYEHLRPLDKREVLLFRLRLIRFGAPSAKRRVTDSLNIGGAPEPSLLPPSVIAELRREVDDFARFVELSRAINRREVLHRFDRRQLNVAEMLFDSEAEVADVLEVLMPVYGRSPALDALLRLARFGAPVNVAELREAAEEASAMLAAGIS